MTITEDEIRTALGRAVERADRSGDDTELDVGVGRARHPRRRVLVAAAVALVVLAALAASFGTRHGDQIRTGTPPAATTAATLAVPDLPTTTSPPDPTTTGAPRSTVVVRVLNGSGTSGAAGALTAQVAALGYQTVPAANAGRRFDRSEVFYAADHEGSARTLADRLGIALVSPLPDGSVVPDDGPAPNVVVVVGYDRVTPPG